MARGVKEAVDSAKDATGRPTAATRKVASMIRAGREDEVKPKGEWIFVDLGFATSERSTGYLHLTSWETVRKLATPLTIEALRASSLRANRRSRVNRHENDKNKAYNFTFGRACQSVQTAAASGRGVLHLVLEAPLSGAFNKDGNPTARRVDIQTIENARHERPWYRQAALPALTAAAHLLSDLEGSPKTREVALFEGFVSFKSRRTPHWVDALALAHAVAHRRIRGGYHAASEKCTVCSKPLSFLLGGRLSIPPVILARAPA